MSYKIVVWSFQRIRLLIRLLLQEGYDVDLLNPRQETTPSASHAALPNDSDKEAALSPALNERKDIRGRPWYRTKGGLIGLIILGIVIIAVVVGGAVGGTRHKNANGKASSSNITSSPTSSTAAPQGSGGGLNQGGSPSASGTLGAAQITNLDHSLHGPSATPEPSLALVPIL